MHMPLSKVPLVVRLALLCPLRYLAQATVTLPDHPRVKRIWGLSLVHVLCAAGLPVDHAPHFLQLLTAALRSLPAGHASAALRGRAVHLVERCMTPRLFGELRQEHRQASPSRELQSHSRPSQLCSFWPVVPRVCLPAQCGTQAAIRCLPLCACAAWQLSAVAQGLGSAGLCKACRPSSVGLRSVQHLLPAPWPAPRQLHGLL